MRPIPNLGAWGTMMVTLGVSVSASAQPLQLILNLKERIPLSQLAEEVMDPASPRYQVFYTPEEIRALCAPSDEDYDALITSLRNRGFQVVGESKAHLQIAVAVEQPVVESSLHTKLRFSGRALRGLASPPVIPDDLSQVGSVTGLVPGPARRPHFRVLSSPNSSAPGILPAQIKAAYGFNPLYAQGLSGEGQQIAIATYDGFHMEDIHGFYRQLGITPAPAVDQVRFNGNPVLNEGSALETALDAEFSGMIAPKARIHIFASAENSNAGELQMFTAILDDNRANIVNYSWGSCEAQLEKQHQTDMDKIYSRARAQGVNILVASGDSGSDGCGDGTTSADWPATNPDVVAVGGTSASIRGSALSEVAWGNARGASGGGISKLYPVPAYQKNFRDLYRRGYWMPVGGASMTVSQSFQSMTGRGFPDVAFNADPLTGEAMWTSYSTGIPHWMVIGGTSMAAPQWSGFMALVGESRITHGKGPLGFLNPPIYRMPVTTRAQCFHDVVSGSNGAYKAGPGWDAVTGWGSMDAAKLAAFLISQ